MEGEVDHVGRVAKVAVRREIAAGTVTCLQGKFTDKEGPLYHSRKVKQEDFNKERAGYHCKVFKTIYVSSNFQVTLCTAVQSSSKALHV